MYTLIQQLPLFLKKTTVAYYLSERDFNHLLKVLSCV